MKRSSDLVESGLQTVKVRRQAPISCQWCRKKKLKCDRGSPCSNCRARKLVCLPESGLNQPSPTGTSIIPMDQAIVPLTSPMAIEDIGSRVRRLEDLLANKIQSSDSIGSGGLSRRAKENSPERCENTQTESPMDVELGKAATWLETEAFKQESEPSLPNVGSRVASSTESFVFSTTKSQAAPSFERPLSSVLPSRSCGFLLLDFYLDKINWLYCIIHTPDVKKIFNGLYDRVESNRKPDYGHLSLVSTICAISASISTPTTGLCLDRPEAMSYSRRWASLAQDALAASNCYTNPTLESVQSLALYSQHLLPSDGCVAAVRAFNATILPVARSLALHQVDSTYNKKLRETGEVDLAELEVKRRIWWHITSTDWFLSFMGGPQNGTYTVHPKQMSVDLPSNAHDGKVRHNNNSAQPPECFAGTTFFRARIKLAKIFREAVDDACNRGYDLDKIPYAPLLELDQKIHSFLAETERDFAAPISNNIHKLQESNRMNLDTESRRRAQQLLVQHNMIIYGTHARLSRLHRPYLVRGAREPRFAYSRMVCLRSARTLIELAMEMAAMQETTVKSWFVTHHLFVSTIILVMDYCFNRDEPRAKVRKDEIMECFHFLESSEGKTTNVFRGLQHLRNILQKASNRCPTHLESGCNYPQAIEIINVASRSGSYQAPEEGNHIPATYTTQPQTPAALFWGEELPVTHDANEWPQLGFPSFEDIDFDVEIDISQFEPLFDNNDPMSEVF